MVFIEASILAVIILLLLYKWSTAKYNVLSDRGIPHAKPKPLIGSISWEVVRGRRSFLQFLLEQHQFYKNSKVYGLYVLNLPGIFLRDVDAIKKIGIKDFDKFTNHRAASTYTKDNIFSKTLLVLEDHKWKEMRNTLTPAFTGSKMRLLFELINHCCLEGVSYIKAEIKNSGKHELDMEMMEYFKRFANDVIASAAFGVKVNSFKDKENDFYTIGNAMLQSRASGSLKGILFITIPRIMKALRIKPWDEKQTNYFKSLLVDAVKYRQEHNIIRPDMIHLLMEAKRNSEETKKNSVNQTDDMAEFTDDDLLAQCFLFFIAGFDTVSTCLAFAAYELAMNPAVQELLHEEIVEMERELNGKPLNYDALLQMKYMDMVLSESLRMWPPAGVTDRVCSADYQLTDDEGNLITDIKKGDSVFIPIVALHHDEENFPEPEKFDPERFSDENKQHIKPFTYLPFGVGPRNCIGSRMALMETKSIIYHLVLNFKLVPGEKTSKNMMNSIRGFRMKSKDLYWLKFIPREN